MDILDIENALQTDSFLIEENSNDDELNLIFNKWKQSNTNAVPQTDFRSTNFNNSGNQIDTRTFLRKSTKKKALNQVNENEIMTNGFADPFSLESGIASIDLNGPLSRTPMALMQKSWLLDVSPPNSLSQSINIHMNMSSDLVTSSDFSNINFLMNQSFLEQNGVESPANGTFNVNLMDQTYTEVKNSTFTAKNDGIDEGVEDYMDRTRTYNKYDRPSELRNFDIKQSTPVQGTKNPDESALINLSPIPSGIKINKTRRLINDITQNLDNPEVEEDEDEEFPVTPAINETYECQIEIESNEKDFDEMLNNMTIVKKAKTPEKLSMLKRYSDKQKKEYLNENVQDNKMSELLSKSTERLLNRRSRLYDDFNLQLAKSGENEINKSFTSDKSDKTSDSDTSKEKADSVSTSSENIVDDNEDKFKTIRVSQRESILNERNRFVQPVEPPVIVQEDNNDRDRFKTIRLNKKRNEAMPVVQPAENEMKSKLKSPMGFKSKSCQSLIANGGALKVAPASRMGPPSAVPQYANPNPTATNQFQTKRLQTNLRMPRASSLVRPVSSSSDSKIRQSQYPKSVEDICSESNMRKPMGAVSKPQALRPSNLKPPTKIGGLSGLPRPTFSYSAGKK